MENLEFVKRFIAGTRTGQVKWDEVFSGGGLQTSEGFHTPKEDNDIIIMRLANDTYAMVIRDQFGIEIYRIDENNLLSDLDGWTVSAWDKDDKHALSRLFRLAERSAKRIDDLLDRLTMDLPNAETNLPF